MKQTAIIITLCLAVFYACLSQAKAEGHRVIVYTVQVNGSPVVQSYDLRDQLPDCTDCPTTEDYRE